DSNEKVPGVVVRGVSDLLKGKSQTDGQGWQAKASAAAAAVAFTLMADFKQPGTIRQENEENEQDKAIFAAQKKAKELIDKLVAGAISVSEGLRNALGLMQGKVPAGELKWMEEELNGYKDVSWTPDTPPKDFPKYRI